MGPGRPQHPGELIGLATGPLTNLALALRQEPALPTLLRRLVIMGGVYDYRGNTNAVAEWNIAVDPEAAAEVFAAWSPNEQKMLSHNHSDPMRPRCNSEDLDNAGHSGPAGRRCEHHDDRAERRRRAGHPVGGVEPVDSGDRGRDAVLWSLITAGTRLSGTSARPVAAVVALDPQLVSTRQATVDVE